MKMMMMTWWAEKEEQAAFLAGESIYLSAII